MPLNKSKSKAAFSSNVSELMHSGRPQKQALAIAYRVQRGKKHGGRIRTYDDGGVVDALSQVSPQAANIYRNVTSEFGDTPTPKDIYGHLLDYQRQQQAKVGQAAGRMPGLMAQGVLDVPRRAFKESENLRTTGEYDPEPVVSAATMAMTGGIPFAPRGAVGVFGGKLPPGMVSEPEKIVGAAVRFNGKMYSGPMHPDAVRAAAKDAGVSREKIWNDPSLEADGFLTTSGRYVSRKEALEISDKANQTRRDLPPVIRAEADAKGLDSTYIDRSDLATPMAANQNALPMENLTAKIQRAIAENPELAKIAQQRPAAFNDLVVKRLNDAKARSDQSLREAEFRLGPNPTREEFEKWALRPFGKGAGEPMGTQEGFGQLQDSAAKASQGYTKSLIPPPVPFMERIWQNYAKRMTPDEFMNSEALWGNAARMAEESGMSQPQAFARIANDIFKRMGVDRRLTPESANEFMGAERGKYMLSDILKNKGQSSGGMVYPSPYASGGMASPPWYARAEARALEHSGFIHSPVAGRTDKIPMSVKSGSYVVPADVVSGLGQGNSVAGAHGLAKMFGMGPYNSGPIPHLASGPKSAKIIRQRFADGGVPSAPPTGEPTDIIAAGGEFVVPHDKIAEKFGEVGRGHEIMDRMIHHIRRKTIKTMRKLPGPKGGSRHARGGKVTRANGGGVNDDEDGGAGSPFDRQPSPTDIYGHMLDYQRGLRGEESGRVARGVAGTLGGLAGGFRDWIATPTNYVKEINQPLEVPGQWSEMDQERRNQATEGAAGWGAGTALGMVGTPGAPKGAVGSGAKGIHAYQSSPYDFERYDASKIGTGQGAASYGKGHYFGENELVSGRGGEYWKEFVPRFSEPERMAAERLRLEGWNRERAAEQARMDLESWRNPKDTYAKNMFDLRQSELALLESGKPVGPRTYEVNINARPEQLLAWDRPIRDQDPAVRALQARIGMDPRDNDIVKGAALYRKAGDYFGPKMGKSDFNEAASLGLGDYGIPGIKYLDQKSRQHAADVANAEKVMRQNVESARNDYGAWREELDRLKQKPVTSNYVVFPGNEHLIDILKKYGIAGSAGVPTAMGAASQMQDGK